MLSKVKALVNSAKILILYSPLRDEINPTKIPFIKNFNNLIITVPKENFPNPFNYSVWLKNHCVNRRTALLIPGQQFDLFGTRYGRGGGWYDRLLSQLPPHWQRIGVTKEKNLKQSRLSRQRYDEPVDWLICHTNNGWRAFETGARGKIEKEKLDDINLGLDPLITLSDWDDNHCI